MQLIRIWFLLAAFMAAILLSAVDSGPVGIAVAGLSIFLGAVVLKYIEVYAVWVSEKEALRQTLNRVLEVCDRYDSFDSHKED